MRCSSGAVGPVTKRVWRRRCGIRIAPPAPKPDWKEIRNESREFSQTSGNRSDRTRNIVAAGPTPVELHGGGEHEPVRRRAPARLAGVPAAPGSHVADRSAE